MRRYYKRLAMPLVVLGLLLSAPLVALADFPPLGFDHNSDRRGPGTYHEASNNYGTYYQGHLHGSKGGTDLYIASGEYIEWHPIEIDWIRNNTQGNQHQPAIVFHAFDKDRGGCATGNYYGSWSNLPGVAQVIKGGCLPGDATEMRLTVGLPYELRPRCADNSCGLYYAQAGWRDGTFVNSQYRRGEITISNYWWWALGNDQTVWHRDDMTKFCYYYQQAYVPRTDSWGTPFSCAR